MKKLLTSLLAAATLGTALIATAGTASADPAWRHRHGGYYRHGGIGPGGAAAAGLVGGLILGSALAQPGYYYGPGYAPGYYYDRPVVVRRPVRVYEEPVVIRRTPNCRVFIKYDMYGKPYEYKDCNG